MRVCVPGASGRAGRSAVADLMEHGHQVTGIDVAEPSAGVLATPGRPSIIRADLSNFGQAGEVLRGAAAVVHLADIASAGRPADAVIFKHSVTMNFNVFTAAGQPLVVAGGMKPSHG